MRHTRFEIHIRIVSSEVRDNKVGFCYFFTNVFHYRARYSDFIGAYALNSKLRNSFLDDLMNEIQFRFKWHNQKCDRLSFVNADIAEARLGLPCPKSTLTRNIVLIDD